MQVFSNKYYLVFISCILIVYRYTFGDEPLATRACLYKRIDNTGFLHLMIIEERSIHELFNCIFEMLTQFIKRNEDILPGHCVSCIATLSHRCNILMFAISKLTNVRI